MNITKFHVRNVRCFADEHALDIRPLTFLVGENSTGKSTLLGCLHTMTNLLLRGPFRPVPNFNRPPYQMGSFREIVRKSRPLNEEFELALTLQEGRRDPIQYRFTFRERGDGTEPVISSTKWQFPEGDILCEESDLVDRESLTRSREIQLKKKQGQDGRPLFIVKNMPSNIDWLHAHLRHELHVEKASPTGPEQSLLNLLQKIRKKRGGEFFELYREHMKSIAPLRSEPRRTYDPIAEWSDPGGADIPMRLMNMAGSNRKRWEALRTELIAFGKDSGLFSDLRMQRLGKSSSNPFQIRVKTHGPEVNLIDTGYGVSQILPILVNVLQPSSRMLLVQQPEVHLHPRGQAALTSLLIKQLSTEGRRQQGRRPSLPGYVIETHSDYMIDRARIEIMGGHIDPKNVSLIYLEKSGNRGAQVHNISFDKMGNMLGVPPGYKAFFMKEGDRLLGFDKT